MGVYETLSVVLLVGLIIGLPILAWWLFVETEGVYLGRRVVIWLYDVYANKYDKTKEFQKQYEHLFLAHPIMNAVRPHHDPFILDIATGTARLPLAMLTHSHFEGRIIGIDLSLKMLDHAAYKLAEDLAHVDLILAPAECLPFTDETFDVVTCLEALEFMSSPEAVIQESLRVLRPGGLLLFTLRVNLKTMPGKVWSPEYMQTVLKNVGVERVFLEPWQEEYTKVWGRKAGQSKWSGSQLIEDSLRCPHCRNTKIFIYEPPVFSCQNCSHQIRVLENGVLDMRYLQRSC